MGREDSTIMEKFSWLNETMALRIFMLTKLPVPYGYDLYVGVPILNFPSIDRTSRTFIWSSSAQGPSLHLQHLEFIHFIEIQFYQERCTE